MTARAPSRPRTAGAARRGVYAVISTFFLVLLTLAVVITLVGLAHLMAAAQAKIDDKVNAQHEFLFIRDRVLACAGSTFEPADAGLPCYNLRTTKAAAVVIRQHAFRAFPNATVSLYNSSPPRASQVFAYTAFHEPTHTLCPGDMLLYI